MNPIPKISVRIICYKQEELIKRAINSLLSQREYIYEICVSDDCSPDRTWEVLQEYDRQYPGLFKLHRNDPNVGIFENIEYTWSMPTGDIIYGMAGDDECGEGWFKKVIDFIQKNNIDYKNELFCIYGDYQMKCPNGDVYTGKNTMISKSRVSPLKLAIRHCIYNRSACYSRGVLDKYEKVSQGRSHIAEDAIDRQLQLFSQKSFYIPYVGNIYYANIGVSKNISAEVNEERNKILPYAYSFFEKHGVIIDKSYLSYQKYAMAFENFMYRKSIVNAFKLIWYAIMSYDCEIGFNIEGIRTYLFAIRRRLPHKKPIKM